MTWNHSPLAVKRIRLPRWTSKGSADNLSHQSASELTIDFWRWGRQIWTQFIADEAWSLKRRACLRMTGGKSLAAERRISRRDFNLYLRLWGDLVSREVLHEMKNREPPSRLEERKRKGLLHSRPNPLIHYNSILNQDGCYNKTQIQVPISFSCWRF